MNKGSAARKIVKGSVTNLRKSLLKKQFINSHMPNRIIYKWQICYLITVNPSFVHYFIVLEEKQSLYGLGK